MVTSSLGGVLPVKFEYFTAARQNSSSVLLKWKISLADPAERFEILRSVNGADYAVIERWPALINKANTAIQMWWATAAIAYTIK